MTLGVVRIKLRLAAVSSLKEKRHIVKRSIARIKNKFNVSVAEIGSLDILQRAELGVAVVSNDTSFVNSILDKIIDLVEEMHLAEIIDSELEIIHL